MRIAKLAKIAGAAIIGGLITLTGAGWLMVDELKVGGPHYQSIILGKDLLADILPPPAYIIEPFLESTLALTEPGQSNGRKQRMQALRKDYDTRHAFWSKQQLPGDLAKTFLQDAHASAEQFWQIAEADFFPALEGGDLAKAKLAHEKMSAAYVTHREKIDQTVSQATNMVQNIEVTAASRVSQSMWLAGLVALAVLAAMLAAIMAALKGVVAPITETAAAMRELAGGNMAVSFPGGGRDDEIGDMALAADVFRENAIARNALEHEQEELLAQEHERRTHLERVLEDFEARMQKIGEAHSAATSAASGKIAALDTTEPARAPTSHAGPPAKPVQPAAASGSRKPRR